MTTEQVIGFIKKYFPKQIGYTMVENDQRDRFFDEPRCNHGDLEVSLMIGEDEDWFLIRYFMHPEGEYIDVMTVFEEVKDATIDRLRAIHNETFKDKI